MSFFSKLSNLTGMSSKAKAVPRAPTTHIRVRGTLYVKPSNTNAYKPLTEIGGASFNIVSDVGSSRNYRLQIFEEDSDEPSLEQDVENMTLTYHHDTGAVMWTTQIDGDLQEMAFRAQVDDSARSCGIKFAGELSRAIVDTYNRCLYGQLVGDQTYVDKAPPLSAQASAGNAENNDDDENDFAYVTAPRTQAAVNIREGSPEAAAPSDDDEDIPVFRMDPRGGSVCPTSGKTGRNVCFADSMQYNRTITFRDEGKGKILASATPFTTSGHNHSQQESFLLDGFENMSIGNSCLSSADERQTFLHNTSGKTGITQVDLSVGKVVQEYAPADGYAINSISYAAKTAEKEPNLLTCLSNNVVYSIDKRLDPRNCVVAEVGKSTADYALATTTPKFLCHATSDNGYLAVGSRSGDIRLYSGVPGSERAKGHQPKTAKTLLRGNPKNPIVHLDITHDGTFIVAVTPDYLMVLPTEYTKAGKSTNGFSGRMGKDKPVPLSLSLSGDQLRTMKGQKVNFTTAKFDSKDGEEWIVAACGSFLITWSMASIKKSFKNTVRTSAATGEIIAENNTVNGVNMLPLQGSEVITFITDNEVGMVPRVAGSENQTRKQGFTYFQ